VIVHSDHGDEHWDHGSFDHGQSQHEELLHVPLVLSLPARLPQGKRVAARVRTIDVMPTILEIAGIPAPNGIEGQSLARPGSRRSRRHRRGHVVGQARSQGAVERRSQADRGRYRRRRAL
jgi:arylsulfatase A-like enzyme